MALIEINNMEFYAFHGHFKEEQIVGNKFLIDLTLEADLGEHQKLTGWKTRLITRWHSGSLRKRWIKSQI